jgi:glycosyltransferase involved in cell wall biosynthesis
MKVLQVVPWLVLRAGGTSVVVVGLARALQQLGVDVTIYTTDVAVPAQASDLRRGVTLDDLPAGASELDIKFFPIKHPYRFVYSPDLQQEIARNADCFDAVHIHSLFLHPQYAAWRESNRAGIPLVVSPHGALDPYLRRNSRLQKRVVDVLWQRRMFDNASAIHLTSQEESDLISDLAFRAPHRVIPIGIDVNAFSQLPSGQPFRDRYFGGSSSPLVVSHGRITEKKGLDILVSALPAIRQKHPGTLLALVGPDDEGISEALKTEAVRLGLADAIAFPGTLAGDDLLSALSAADVWALPSHTENFGLALVEAMAAGRAVVTSPHVNIAASAQADDALVMVENTPERVAEAINSLLDNPELRQTLGQNAHEFAWRYDWTRIAEHFASLYESISEKARS